LTPAQFSGKSSAPGHIHSVSFERIPSVSFGLRPLSARDVAADRSISSLAHRPWFFMLGALATERVDRVHRLIDVLEGAFERFDRNRGRRLLVLDLPGWFCSMSAVESMIFAVVV